LDGLDEQPNGREQPTRVLLAQALRRGLLEHSATRWRASAQGFNFLNDLLGLFLPSGMTASLGQEQVPQNFPVRTTAWA